jgi:hypothetical protein
MCLFSCLSRPLFVAVLADFAAGGKCRKAYITGALLVPVERIELPTFGLQNRCSTAELNRRD